MGVRKVIPVNIQINFRCFTNTSETYYKLELNFKVDELPTVAFLDLG